MSNVIPIQFTLYLFLLNSRQVTKESAIPLAENSDRRNGDERKQRQLPANYKHEYQCARRSH
jgi:hypothetical protein